MWLIREGTVDLTVNGTSYRLGPGSVGFVHSNDEHGIKNIGYWVNADGKPEDQKLIYVVAHKSREAAAQNWKDFASDPDWKAAQSESEKDGKLAIKVESVYMNPTDFSKLK